MKKHVLTLLLSGMMCGSFASAQTLWSDVGGVLKDACKFTNGGSYATGGKILSIGYIDNLSWLCSLNSLYKFVDGTFVKGDWQQFGYDVMGQWIGDAVNQISGELGLGGANAWVSGANNWVRQGYKEFRRSALYAWRDAYINSTTDGLNFVQGSKEDKTNEYVRSNPVTVAVDELGKVQRTDTAIDSLEQAWKMNYQSESAKTEMEEIAGTVSQITMETVGMKGVPGLGAAATGSADLLVERAQAAVSTRQVAEMQVEGIAQGLKQNAVLDSAIVSSIMAVAKQGLLTNQQLAELIGRQRGDTADMIDAQKAVLEKIAEEDIVATESLIEQLEIAGDSASTLVDPNFLGGLTW